MRARIATSGPDARAAEEILQEQGCALVGAADSPIDLLVVDEWTAETDAAVVAARRSGTRVTVLGELILEHAPRPIVGVTGTAGKTSTCRALESILRECGLRVNISSTARSGNAWPDHSLAGQLRTPAPGAITIAELTSTHLCHMTHVHPDVAVVTTIRPDHVELHGSLEAYVAAKRKLIAELGEADAVVLPADDPQTLAALGRSRGTHWWFGVAGDGGTGDGRSGAFGVAGGIHLRAPDGEARRPTALEGPPLRAALAAAAAALALGVAPHEVARGIGMLPVVAHRQAARQGPRGITIVDDTMAATPLKVQAAVERFAGPGLVVVVGGDDALAGSPVHSSPEEQALLAEALQAVRDSAGAVVAFGPARERILPHLSPDAVADGIGDAVAVATDLCPDGGTVLVSPMFPLTPQEREAAAGRA